MHGDITVSTRAITTFILVLSRILGTFAYLPLPGKEAGPSLARVVLAFSVAIAIVPFWSWVEAPEPTFGLLLVWIGSELALGLTIGLVVSFLAEALTVGAHILALQAGYAYASVIDPVTQADSDVLQVLAQLLGGLLFFSLGLDRLAIRTFVYSLNSFPPGHFELTSGLAQTIVALGANIFTVGLRLALPAVAMLLATEICLALLGRLSAQLHLGANAASIKMLLALVILGSVVGVVPRLYESYANQSAKVLQVEFWNKSRLLDTH